MAGSKEESSFAGIRTPRAPWSALILAVLSLAYTLVVFGPMPDLWAIPGVPDGAYWTASLVFLVPGFLGSLLAVPFADLLGGKMNVRRGLFTGVLMFVFLGVGLLLWRGYFLLHGAYPLEGVLLAIFGTTVWLRQMVLSAISGPTPTSAIPQALSAPAAGVVMVWSVLGLSPLAVAEGVIFLLIPLGAIAILLHGADRPLVREFGKGGVSILRHLMDHINERDPVASRKMEEFFAASHSRHDLTISALRFRPSSGGDLLWIAPTIHPGPFADLGASNLPHKMVTMLAGSAQEIVVVHAPCTHDQNIPTTEEVQRVAAEFQTILPKLGSAGAKCSSLVSPYEKSLVRAQVLGDTVLLFATQAPAASDDIDYSVGEMVREEAQRQGFRLGIIVDAHNVYVQENMGTIPFGSPASFQLVKDAKAAMVAAKGQAGEGPLRVGFSRRRGYTTRRDGLGGEGICVTVVEAGGKRTAYALLDGNNLVSGFREALIQVLRKQVDDAEVLTTDNHVVHEVENGINPIGKLRSLEDFSADLDALVKEAVADLKPVEVYTGDLRVKNVKVMGHASTTRLMTALNDSFSVFWVLMPTTLLVTVLGEMLILALFP